MWKSWSSRYIFPVAVSTAQGKHYVSRKLLWCETWRKKQLAVSFSESERMSQTAFQHRHSRTQRMRPRPVPVLTIDSFVWLCIKCESDKP